MSTFSDTLSTWQLTTGSRPRPRDSSTSAARQLLLDLHSPLLLVTTEVMPTSGSDARNAGACSGGPRLCSIQ